MKRILGNVLLMALAAACVTSGSMKQRRYVDPTAVKTIDDDSEAPNPAAAARERSTTETLKSRIAVLEGELEEAKELHRREVAALAEQLRVLTEENSKNKVELEAASKVRMTEDTKKAAALLWKAATDDIKAAQLDSALSLLKQLVDRYPEDSHAYYAHMTTAMIFYTQKKFSSAAGAFVFVAQKYPQAEGIQMAWYGQGAGLYKMLKGSESLLFFKQTASRWPKTPEGKHAASVLAKKAQPVGDLFLAFPNWLKDAPN